MKKILDFIWETSKVVLIALIIVIPIRYYLFQPFVVSGQSMEPNFSHGNYLIVDEISYRFNEPERGDVVVFFYPNDPSLRHIKRIIGLPSEKIFISDMGIQITKNETEFILDESEYLSSYYFSGEQVEIELSENEFFVMGDNRSASFDSRKWGSLDGDYIIGRALVRLLPLNQIEKFNSPSYSY